MAAARLAAPLQATPSDVSADAGTSISPSPSPSLSLSRTRNHPASAGQHEQAPATARPRQANLLKLSSLSSTSSAASSSPPTSSLSTLACGGANISNVTRPIEAPCRHRRRSSATQELLLTKCHFYHHSERDTEARNLKQPAATTTTTSRAISGEDISSKSVQPPLDDDGCDLDYDENDDDDDDVENFQSTATNCISSPTSSKRDKLLLSRSSCCYKISTSGCNHYKQQQQQQQLKPKPVVSGVSNGAFTNGLLASNESVQRNEQAAAQTRQTLARLAQTLRTVREVAQTGVANRRRSDNLPAPPPLGSDTGAGYTSSDTSSSPIATTSGANDLLSPNDSVASKPTAVVATARQAVAAASKCGSQQLASISRCSTGKLSATTTDTSFDEATSSIDAVPKRQPQDQYQQQQIETSGSLLFNPAPATRRHSSPHYQQQQFRANYPAGRQLSIEEQIKRLLDIEPSEEDIKRSLQQNKQTNDHNNNNNNMKKSTMFGGGQQQQHQYESYNQHQPQQQQQQSGQQRYRQSAGSGFSPSDKMMIFMMASRSTQTNSTVERNARILKWLNNCKDAR